MSRSEKLAIRNASLATRPVTFRFCMLVALGTVLSGSARAQSSGTFSADPEFSKPFEICRDQTYALCTGAKCTVFNGVAYCQCDVKHGKSLSKTLVADGKDVCQINAAGPDYGYMVSTFSEPTSIVAPSGNQALYNCPHSATGAYATCDGGICFTSTQGKVPTSQGEPAGNGIICSCPITKPTPRSKILGHQIIGPYPCEASFFQYCSGSVSNGQTGSTIYAAAPTGAVRINTFLLTGKVPPVNVCNPNPH